MLDSISPVLRSLVLLAASLAAGCAATPSPNTPVASPPAAGEAPGAPAVQCSASQYAVKGGCYDSREEACAAAGCQPTSCVVAETAPMQVHCGG